MAVRSVAFSPVGARLATGSSDRSIGLWDLESGEHLLKISGHRGEICDLAYSPDGGLLASASGDLDVRLWPVL